MKNAEADSYQHPHFSSMQIGPAWLSLTFLEHFYTGLGLAAAHPFSFALLLFRNKQLQKVAQLMRNYRLIAKVPRIVCWLQLLSSRTHKPLPTSTRPFYALITPLFVVVFHLHLFVSVSNVFIWKLMQVRRMLQRTNRLCKSYLWITYLVILVSIFLITIVVSFCRCPRIFLTRFLAS